MNSNSPLSFATIYETVKSLLALIVTLSGAVTVVLTFGWWILQPRVQPYLDAFDQIAELAARVADNDARLSVIENSVPELQVLEYRDGVDVIPTEVKPGGKITITYVQRRNFPCAVTIVARFYSVNSGGFDLSLGYSFSGIRAPITDRLEPFSIVLPVPAEIAPGRWAYEPEIVPSIDCPSTTLIYPPPAYFTVVAAENEESQ